MTVKWDYKVIDLHGTTREMREKILKELGEKRWELVNVAKNGAAYLKQSKEVEYDDD